MTNLVEDFSSIQLKRRRLVESVEACERDLKVFRAGLKATDREFYTKMAHSATVRVAVGAWSYKTLTGTMLGAMKGAEQPDTLVVSDFTHKKFYLWMSEHAPEKHYPVKYNPDDEYRFWCATLHRGDVDMDSMYFINSKHPNDSRLNVLLRLERETE